MKRLAFLGLLLLTLAPAAAAKGPQPLLGLEWRLGGGVTLRQYDAATLRPLPQLRRDLGYFTNVLARSPDGRRLLVAHQSFVRFVDLRTGRLSPKVFVGEWLSSPSSVLWARPNAVVVVALDEVLVIDPRVPRVVGRRDRSGDVLAAVRWLGSASVPARLVLLLSPHDAVGRLAVAVVDTGGRIRRTAIDMRGGLLTLRDAVDNPTGLHEEAPALALDPSGRRAFVGGLATAAVVGLDDLDSSVHALVARTPQKMLEGWSRGAQWLDATHVAVYGSDHAGGTAGSTPVRVQVVDVSDWTTRRLEVVAADAVRFGSLLVAFGDRVTAVDAAGRVAFTSPGPSVGGIVVAGHAYIYAETTGHGVSYVVLHPADGHVVARRTFARPTAILAGL
jgi:hypothetical protein